MPYTFFETSGKNNDPRYGLINQKAPKIGRVPRLEMHESFLRSDERKAHRL
jgi:hypothetical protein